MRKELIVIVVGVVISVCIVVTAVVKSRESQNGPARMSDPSTAAQVASTSS